MLDRNNIEKPKKKAPKRKPKTAKTMYRNGTKYTFTFNFNDDCQHFGSKDRIKLIYSDYKIMLKQLQKVASFELYFEFSTPDAYKCLNKMGYHSGPRFHIHGIVIFHDVIKYYLDIYTQLLNVGLFEIDTIEDMEVWRTYITKDKPTMQKYIKSLNYKHMLYPTIYTHKSLIVENAL